VDQDAYDDLLQRFTALVIILDSTYDKLTEFVDEQREFNRQQVAINQRLETLLERAWRASTNGPTD
jgi:peptidoglycan hydrolase CwlO-like protein